MLTAVGESSAMEHDRIVRQRRRLGTAARHPPGYGSNPLNKGTRSGISRPPAFLRPPALFDNRARRTQHLLRHSALGRSADDPVGADRDIAPPDHAFQVRRSAGQLLQFPDIDALVFELVVEFNGESNQRLGKQSG